MTPDELCTAARHCLQVSILAGRIPARPGPEAIAHIADTISTLETPKASSGKLDALDTCGGNASATTTAA
jgi:hypothetical protein